MATLQSGSAQLQLDAASRAGPIAPSDRIAAIDIVRGIALFGVMAMNIVTEFRTSIFERFLAALLKGAELGRQQTPEVMDVVAKYTGLEVSVLRDTIWTDMAADGTVNVASLKDQLDFFRRAGLMQGTVDIDRFVDMSYLPRR